MEKMNNNIVIVRNNRLPPGFRFQPTDEELVFEYLKCKVFSSQLPASIIPHINVCNYDPWDLPGNSDRDERYYFSKKEGKYRNGNRMNRTTNSGYWKATGSDKKISPPTPITSSNIIIFGIRKTLVFYKGKSPNASRTDWIMHEYRLLTLQSTPCNSSQSYVNELGDWVVCRIFMKKTSIESDHNDNTVHHHHNNHMLKNNNTVMKNYIDVAKPILFFDFMRVHNNSASGPIHYSSTSSSTCSSSSYITQLSSLDHEETNACVDF